MKILVTGGVRSGKSRHAEGLLTALPSVTYVAPGPTPDEDADPDWAARIAAHQARRPARWQTVETRDLARALHSEGPVLVDCLGTWLSAVLDQDELWESDSATISAAVDAHLNSITEAISDREDIVIVTNEVGLGVVPAHRSGRLFRDLLGTVNQRIAAVCDEVHLVVAGRHLVL